MSERYAQDTSGYDRGLGFFDAVYGFALTLLVTTVDVTGRATWESPASFLDANGTQLASFAVSFVVIVAFWRQNHQMLARFRAIDGTVIVANVVVMAFVVFIPFTTDAMGDPDLADLALPTALYALNIALAVSASIVVFEVGRRRGLLDRRPSPAEHRAELIDALATPAVFLASIPVTYLAVDLWSDAAAGKWVWALLLVVKPLTGRRLDRITAEVATVPQ